MKKVLQFFVISMMLMAQIFPTILVVAETLDELSMEELAESEVEESQQPSEEPAEDSEDVATTEVESNDDVTEVIVEDESHEVVDGTLPENESVDSNLDIFNAGTTTVDILQNFNHIFAHDATTIPNWEISTTTVPVGSINRNLSFELDRTTQFPLTGFTNFYRLSDPAFEIRSNRGSSATGSGSLTRIERISGNRQVIMSQTMATQPGFEYILPVNATGNGTITITIYNGNGIISGPNAISVTEIPAGESGHIHFFAEGNQTTFGVRFNGSSLGMGGMGWGFQVPNRNVSVEKNLDGAGTVSLTNSTPAQGATTNLRATVNEGYRFVRWEIISGEGSILSPSSMSTSLSVRATDVQVRAVYEAIPRTLTLESNIENAGNPTADETTLTIGQTTTLRAQPNVGYEFVSWEVISGGATITNPTSETATFTMSTADAVIRANYTEAMEITAEGIPQILALGGNFIGENLLDMVRVSLNGEELSNDAYEVTLSNQPNTNHVHEQEIQANVTHRETGAEVQVTIPVEVVWGDSINISGSWVGGPGFRSVGAYTLHPGRGITFTPATNINMNQASFSNHVGNRPFSRLCVFSGTDSLLIEGDDTESYFSFEMIGTQSPNQIISNFQQSNGGDNLIDVSFGDVVRSWTFYRNNNVHNDHVINNRRWNILREGGEKVDYSNGFHNIYYEITEHGYRPLVINHAQVSTGITNLQETEEQLDQRIEEFIEIPEGIDSVEFVSYPDRSSTGTSTGTIRVSQTSTIGNAIEFDYEVEFTVEEGLVAEGVPQTIDLGGRFVDTNLLDMVQASFNGEELPREAYEVELISQPETAVAERTVDTVVEVTHKDTGLSIEVRIPTTVTFGDGIRLNNVNGYSAGVYNWHPSLGIITARRGTASTTGTVNSNVSEIYFSFNLHSLEQGQKSFVGDETRTYTYDVRGNQTIASAVSGFAEGAGFIDAEIGDVVEIYGRNPARLRQYVRPALWHDEHELISSLNNRAYFELTDTGYQLLNFDRAIPVPSTIQIGKTSDALDKMVESYLDLSAASNVSIVGFETYPDTTQVGRSTGVIRVEERLSTGQYVLRDYEVEFTVEAGGLELSEVANGTFDFGNVKQSSRKQVIAAQGDQAPTITVSDYSDATQWSVYASASPFINEASQELRGADLTLSDLKIAETVHTWTAVAPGDILLGSASRLIATMSNPKGIYGDEHGQTIIQIGEASNDQLTGVSLSLPANTPMDTGAYQTTVTWELVGDPTIGGSR